MKTPLWIIWHERLWPLILGALVIAGSVMALQGCSYVRAQEQQGMWHDARRLISEQAEKAAAIECYNYKSLAEMARPYSEKMPGASFAHRGSQVGGTYNQRTGIIHYTTASTLLHEYVHHINHKLNISVDCYDELVARLVQELYKQESEIRRLNNLQHFKGRR